MKFFQSAIISLFLFFTLSALAQDEVRQTTGWRVLKYDITANVPQSPTDRTLTAKTVLSLQNIGTSSASRLTLRISSKADVSSVTVNNSSATFTKAEEKPNTLQRIIVNLSGIQPDGNVTVSVDYKLKVDENSGLNMLSPIGTQFLPLGFWYPTPNSAYFTRGADFAPFHLQVNGGNGQTVVSSGTGNGSIFDQKLSSQPFFMTGNWDAVESKGVTIYLPKDAGAAERKRAEELADLTVEAKTYMASLLGSSTEAPTKIAVVRRGSGFADGGTILLDYGAFRRQKIDSQTAMNIADAVAKVYLGNAAQVRGDGYGVIREGLSRYIATQFIEKQFGKDAADIERMRQRTAYAAIVRRDAPLNLVSPVDDYYYTEVANKGAMVWRLLAKTVGEQNFFNIIKAQTQTGTLTLPNLRGAFSAQKPLLDYLFDQVTDLNLLVGLPQQAGGSTKVALRNLGSLDATVNVVAVTDKGEKLTAQATIPAKNFSEVSFTTTSKIVRTEIDPDKLFPQVDFSDDVAPREFTESDPILVIKRAFDKQDAAAFALAEKNARTVLATMPHFDDARTWLGRALLAQNKNADAEKEFRAVLDEKLPTSRSLAWANVGLGEIALRNNQNAQAIQFFNEAIKDDAEYGATFSARTERDKLAPGQGVDDSVRAFFAQFDKAAISGRKADMDALILSGEVPRFSSGIGGQAQQWETKVVQVDKIDSANVLAETNLNIRLLNKDAESGTAVFRLTKVGNDWKLSGVEIFEVR